MKTNKVILYTLNFYFLFVVVIYLGFAFLQLQVNPFLWDPLVIGGYKIILFSALLPLPLVSQWIKKNIID
jgi:hypothetical protein